MSEITVPLLDLKAQYATIRDHVRRAIDEIVKSQYFILGPIVEKLEQQVTASCGVRRLRLRRDPARHARSRHRSRR